MVLAARMAAALCLLAVGWGLWLARPAAAAPVRVAAAGQALLPVVVVDGHGELMASAWTAPTLADLTECLEKISRARFVLSTQTTLARPVHPAIYVGLRQSLEGLDLPRDLHPAQSLVRSTPAGSLVLTGATPRAVMQAVYTWLDHLGCRWYFPGADWAIIPTQSLLVTDVDLLVEPDFPVERRLWLAGGIGTPAVRREFADWQRRNRCAEPFDIAVSHTWFGLDESTPGGKPNRNQVFAQHPEWFALVEGQRDHHKPCYAHPEVIQRGIDYALDYFARHPQAAMVSVSPPDGAGFCACPRTLAVAQVTQTHLLPPHRTLMGTRAQGQEVCVTSEEVFHFANQIARAVATRLPGKQVGVLAYTAYAHPPSFQLEPNVHVALTSGYRFTPLTLTEQIEAFAQRCAALSIYEYYDVVQWNWDLPGRSKAARLDHLQESTRASHRAGIRGVSGEMGDNFAPYGIGYYALTRLLWDIRTEVRQVEREFLHTAFGAAAETVGRVYNRWETQRWDGERAEPLQLLADTCADLQQAADLTTPGSPARRRIDALRLYAHFLRLTLPMRVGQARPDVRAWRQRYGEAEAAHQLLQLADWNRRLLGTHLVHAFPLSRYLAERGQIMGLPTEEWSKPAPLPTSEALAQLFAADLLATRSAAAAVLDAPAQDSDYCIGQAGDIRSQTGQNLGVGQYTPGRSTNAVLVFELPVLPVGQTVVAARLSAYLGVVYAKAPEVSDLAFDLWGLGFRDQSTPIARYVQSPADPEPMSAALVQPWFVQSAVTGASWVQTDQPASVALGRYVQSFYQAHPDYRGGWYVFLRVNPDRDPGSAAPQTGCIIRSARSSTPPLLRLQLAPSSSAPE